MEEISHVIGKDKVRPYISEELKNFAAIVGSSLGPNGMLTLNESADRDGTPDMVKDGITIAQRYRQTLTGIPRAVADYIASIPQTSDNLAGDGTTTTIILLDSLYHQCLAMEGVAPIVISQRLEALSKGLAEYLDVLATPCTQDVIRQIALTSCNGDVGMADTVVEAYTDLGLGSDVKLVKAFNLTGLKVVSQDGFHIKNARYNSSMFINDEETMTAGRVKPYVFCTNANIRSIEDYWDLVEFVGTQPTEEVKYEDKMVDIPNGLVIFCKSIDDSVQEQIAKLTQVHSERPWTIQILPVIAPDSGDLMDEILGDIATYTNATFHDSRQLVDPVVEDLGRAMEVVAHHDWTKIIGGDGDMTGILDVLRKRLVTSENDFEKGKIQERIARITGDLRAILCGGTTPSEIEERFERLKDANNSVAAAREFGVIAGGGIPLLRYKDAHFDLSEPFKRILTNAGYEDVDGKLQYLLENKGEGNEGYDARTGEIANMYEEGILDACMVTKQAAMNACAGAGSLIRTANIIRPPL